MFITIYPDRYGKIVGVFVSTGGIASGVETTCLSCLPIFAHFGLIYVPLGYASTKMFDEVIRGGSPWGNICIFIKLNRLESIFNF